MSANSRPVPSLTTLGDEIVRGWDEIGSRPLDAALVGSLARHLSLLLTWNQRINLTAIRQPAEAARRHTVESLQITDRIDPPEGFLVDLGSGNGYPALPLLQRWAELRGALLDASARKCDFLRAVVRELGLRDRVEVIQRRLLSTADLPHEASIVTMRAFPEPSLWVPDCLLLPNVRHVFAWLSLSDASLIEAAAAGSGRRVESYPLRGSGSGAVVHACRQL